MKLVVFLSERKQGAGQTDGLRLAIELKPVNLAVGRAIWNRFGDIRTFAVNLHLKFPFCVVGAVLTIPTYEEIGTPEAIRASQHEDAALNESSEAEATNGPEDSQSGRKSTVHLIERAIARLIRAGGRQTEGDAAHLLEGIAVVVYDPDSGLIVQGLPAARSGLRWEEFIDTLVAAYKGRFEEV